MVDHTGQDDPDGVFKTADGCIPHFYSKMPGPDLSVFLFVQLPRLVQQFLHEGVVDFSAPARAVAE